MMPWQIRILSGECPFLRLSPENPQNCEHGLNETKLCRIEYCPINAPSDSPTTKVCDGEDALRVMHIKECMDCPYCMVKANQRGCANPDIENRWRMYSVADIGDILDHCPLSKVSEQSREDWVKKCQICDGTDLKPIDDEIVQCQDCQNKQYKSGGGVTLKEGDC